jgi:pimeloyl-ACP methyl ester carboxylesterase
VLVPGIQGHWEWMTPAIDSLSARHRVLTFSLSEVDADAPALFDAWVDSIDRLVDQSGAARVTLAGVSFGGLIAVRYAAVRPDRVARLVLVSSPGPRARLDAASARYLRAPLLTFPVFGMHAALRMLPEILASRPTWLGRLGFATRYARWAVRRPISPRHMVRWVRAWQAIDLEPGCRRITAPTLIITGDPALDRVVPVSSTLEYRGLIAGASHETIAGTGHVGLVSQPDRFAGLVGAFIERTAADDAADDSRTGRSARGAP